jgi:hypothetical protein
MLGGVLMLPFGLLVLSGLAVGFCAFVAKLPGSLVALTSRPQDLSCRFTAAVADAEAAVADDIAPVAAEREARGDPRESHVSL